jgi:multiple sugar transport system substrate-binding protein
MTEKKVSRREYLKVVGAGIVGLGVGAAVGYGVTSFLMPEKVKEVVKPIQTIQGATVAERAINGAKELVESGKVPKGTEIPVLCPSGLAAAIDLVKDEWENQTGTKAVALGVPEAEMYEKPLLEAVAKTGQYAAYLNRPWMLGEMVEANAIIELDDLIRMADPRLEGMPDGFAYPLVKQYVWYRGHYYSLPLDGDTWIAYYRKDLLEDPAEQEAFEKQYGYPLKVPETMDEYRDVCEFFTRPDQNFYGNNEPRYKVNCHSSFYWRLANKKYPCMLPFDDDMHPTLNSPEGLRAAKQFLEMVPFFDPAITNFSYGEHCNYFAQGHAFAAVTFPSFGKYAEASGTVTKGKVLYALPPGEVVEGPGGQMVLNRRTIQGGGWTYMVSRYYKYPELAYYFGQFLTSPEWIVKVSVAPGSFADPIRYNQLGPLADPLQYTAFRKEEIDTLYTAAMTAIPLLCIRKAAEYHKVVYEAMHGGQARVLAGEDIDTVAADIIEAIHDGWEEITDREGRDEMKISWQYHKQTYPIGLIT